MAGTLKGRDFIEKIPPFLKEKMEEARMTYGENSLPYKALFLQYIKTDAEKIDADEGNRKHYEAGFESVSDDSAIKGMERLYRRSVVIETTMICAAHCRYCLRANYDIFTLTEDELLTIAKFLGSPGIREEVKEVLITGGDPLIIPRKLNYLLEMILEHAPNIKIARIATRLLTQDPARIDTNVYEVFRNKQSLRLELATQINHPVEFFPEAVSKLDKFNELGIKIYSQNVLLKGVNDDFDTLVELYDAMRYYNIEAHYLFHAIPLKGTHHLRPSVEKGLALVRRLTSSGYVSGRAKPMFALMTEIGKITLYEGSILGRNERNEILVQSGYLYSERKKWNPNWTVPKSAEVDDNGYLRMWYLDGDDK